MKAQPQRIMDILEKFENHEASAEEIRELDRWYHSFENDPDMTAGMTAMDEQRLRSMQLGRLNTRLDKEILPMVPVAVRANRWKGWMVAASVLLVLFAGTFFVLNRKQPVPVQVASQEIPDFAPGSNKAILTLSNGKTILLDDAIQGKLATEGGTEINKTADGEVVYQGSSLSARGNDATGTELMLQNTMTTPRGGQYQLTLADGTQVWLNAASSISYPAAFVGKERLVEITGEVYFQVAHNAAKPFLVKSNGQTVRVLGTHFNINAYDNEGAIKTTLLEGSVRVSYAPRHADNTQRQPNNTLRHADLPLAGSYEANKNISASNKFISASRNRGAALLGVNIARALQGRGPDLRQDDEGTRPGADKVVLRPGEQSILSKSGNIDVTIADTDEVMAWKQGYFDFVKTDIQTLMRQVSRWYDVDVVFEGPISKETFTGRISRSRNISKVLEIVKASNAVQITFEGRRIMVR